jgi:siroheme synthase (precorrin-2 oxidase/ferrochelatase)
MKGYPLFLNLQGERCVVFGGGKVAYRKIQALLKRGAKVTCVSKDFCGPLERLSLRAPRSGAKQSLRLLRRPFGPPRTGSASATDGNDWLKINGARLVIAATSEPSFNARVARACRRRKIWVNVVDEPGLCDFYVPAVLERGPLQIALSTGGTSPLFARRLREELGKAIPMSTGKLLEKIGKIRKKVLRKNLPQGSP